MASLSACSGATPTDAAAGGPALIVPEPEFTEEELTGSWQQLANPSLATSSNVFSTPLGWFSLSRREFGPDGKIIEAMASYLYRSEDGVHWHLVALPQGGPATEDANDDVFLTKIVFADGKLVLGGTWAFNDVAILTSRDGETFEHFHAGPVSGNFSDLTYAGDRFFALSWGAGYASPDGTKWGPLQLSPDFLPYAATYGNSLYLVVGNGGLDYSSDAKAWQHVEIDCSIASACPPGEGSHDILNTAAFLDGRFYVNSLSSTDGINWQSEDRVPELQLGGYDLAQDRQGWSAWKPGTDPTPLDLHSFPLDAHGTPINPGVLAADELTTTIPVPPQTANFDLDSGENCQTSRCIVLGGRLYLSQ